MHVSLVSGSLAKCLAAADAAVDQQIDRDESETDVAGNSLRIRILSGLSQCLAMYRARVVAPRRVCSGRGSE
jgi:hypothetical protein